MDLRVIIWGSVTDPLGPLLFTMFTADVPSLPPRHSVTGHLYANDVQALLHGPPAQQIIFTQSIEIFPQDLHLWMSSNHLSVNSSKTQLI